MNKKQYILLAIQAVLVLIITVLPFIEPQSIEPQNNEIWNGILRFALRRKLAIAIICSALLAITSIVKDLFIPRQQKREMRERIMEIMMRELFDNNRDEVRITIFKDTNTYRHSLIYLKLCGARWKSGKVLPPRWGKFICIKERLRGADFTKSKTFFRFSDSRKSSEGIAGQVRTSFAVVVRGGLPDISDIDLTKIDIQQKRQGDVKRVRDYMALGYVTNFETLKRINVKSKHFYGNILQNSSGDPKGVLVIDSIQAQNPFDNSAILQQLSYYQELFTPTM